MHCSVWCWKTLSYGSSHGPVWGSTRESEQLGVMRYYNVDESSFAVCCSVMQCIAVCGSVLQSSWVKRDIKSR